MKEKFAGLLLGAGIGYLIFWAFIAWWLPR